MYIISKNKDYYDGVVGSVGMDKTIVYERVSEEITDRTLMPKEFHAENTFKRENPFLNVGYIEINHRIKSKYFDTQSFVIGFCGKLYLGWKLFYKATKISKYTGIPYESTEYDIFYNIEKMKKHLTDGYSFRNNNFEDDVKYVQNYDAINMFREFKTPIFVYDGARRSYKRTFTVNPILKDYQFYKVVDAFTAFTELQMFISGVLGTGENDIIEIEDKYKIMKHGFDKWSFRKESKNKK